MAKIISKAQMSQQIADMLKDLKQRMHTSVEAMYDPTRIYEYGAIVHLGWEDVGSGTKIVNEMRDWCNKTYGPKPYGEYYGDRWMVSNNTFWFKHEKDRTMFLMRWS